LLPRFRPSVLLVVLMRRSWCAIHLTDDHLP
jgi:hypothetical protein